LIVVNKFFPHNLQRSSKETITILDCGDKVHSMLLTHKGMKELTASVIIFSTDLRFINYNLNYLYYYKRRGWSLLAWRVVWRFSKVASALETCLEMWLKWSLLRSFRGLFKSFNFLQRINMGEPTKWECQILETRSKNWSCDAHMLKNLKLLRPL
jgi:hypothetical protein